MINFSHILVANIQINLIIYFHETSCLYFIYFFSFLPFLVSAKNLHTHTTGSVSIPEVLQVNMKGLRNQTL